MALASRWSRPQLLLRARSLIQPHDLRPSVIDQLTGKEVAATFDGLGRELPDVDLRRKFSPKEIEAIKQASDDAGGILVFTNQSPDLSVQDQVRFGQLIADSDKTCIEPHAVAEGHKDAPEVLEIVREPTASVVFGENWHSDNSFMEKTCSYSILRGWVVPRLGVNDTLFSSTEAAYDLLPPAMQRLLLDLNAYHSANKAEPVVVF